MDAREEWTPSLHLCSLAANQFSKSCFQAGRDPRNPTGYKVVLGGKVQTWEGYGFPSCVLLGWVLLPSCLVMPSETSRYAVKQNLSFPQMDVFLLKEHKSMKRLCSSHCILTGGQISPFWKLMGTTASLI